MSQMLSGTQPVKKPMNARLKRALKGIGLVAAVMAFLAWFLGPILWAFLESITPQAGILSMPPHWLPTDATLANYISLLFSNTAGSSSGVNIQLAFPIGYYFREGLLNSVLYASASTIIILLISSLAGYSFARMNFRGKSVLFVLLLFNLSVPTISTLIPLFKEIEYFGLFGTFYALILLYSSRVSLPTWILRNFFETIPHEIEESAMIDGCSRIGALFRVVLPVARSGVIAVAIIAFLTTWDDFLVAVIFANSPSIQPFPVIITDFATEQTTLTGLMFAAAILSFIVPMIIAFALQKYLITGLTSGSLKG